MDGWIDGWELGVGGSVVGGGDGGFGDPDIIAAGAGGAISYESRFLPGAGGNGRTREFFDLRPFSALRPFYTESTGHMPSRPALGNVAGVA